MTVEANVIEGVTTSSPGPIPRAERTMWSPAVAEVTATACGAPVASRKIPSSSATLGPLVIQPERSDSATAATSSSPRAGRDNGRKSSRIFKGASVPRGVVGWVRAGSR